MSHSIFVTGASGYMGRQLIPELALRGHQIKALVRRGSKHSLPAAISCVVADPLLMDSYVNEIGPADTFVHLIGVPHPSPAKAAQFREIDLVSIRVAVKAARDAGVRHFVYLSVAQPAPVMKAFLEVRRQGEEMIRASGMSSTFVRPWYVLGPGHRWAYVLLPFYWLFERLPATRESAQRLGLITLSEMLTALVWAVENPVSGTRILGVPEIRALNAGRPG
jgi:uncharacterized protein YbjT (DUF2867 family)